MVKGSSVNEVEFVLEQLSQDEKIILADYVYDVIKHGDDEHRQWLRDKVNEIFKT